MEFGAEYFRSGQGPNWVRQGYERPVTRSLQDMAEAIREAQGALREGDQQMAGQSDLERQVARVEQLRQQLERLQQQARGQQGQEGQQQQGGQQQGGQQQGGQQQGGQQQGGQQQGGQQQGGQQQGGQQQGGQQQGGQQQGGNQYGAGGPNGGNIDRYGRYNPQGVYDRPGVTPVDPRQIAQEARRDLAEIRAAYRDNPELAGQVQRLERALQDLTFGNPSGPELQERLNRTILPQLETLEVQLRTELAAEQGGQVRSAATDRTPAGYADAIAEYFRRLSRTSK
jgi:hypothetical protein